MQAIYDLLPVLLFFLAFKWYGMYAATIVGMAATAIQVLLSRLLKGKWVKQEIITLAVFVVFGSMTLYFHNPIFVKWKPTIVFSIFSVVMLGSLFTVKPLLQRMMEHLIERPEAVTHRAWKKLTVLWAVFFLTLAGINLIIAYYCSDATWVNFKFYGITGALLLLSLLQALYLFKLTEQKTL